MAPISSQPGEDVEQAGQLGQGQRGARRLRQAKAEQLIHLQARVERDLERLDADSRGGHRGEDHPACRAEHTEPVVPCSPLVLSCLVCKAGLFLCRRSHEAEGHQGRHEGVEGSHAVSARKLGGRQERVAVVPVDCQRGREGEQVGQLSEGQRAGGMDGFVVCVLRQHPGGDGGRLQPQIGGEAQKGAHERGGDCQQAKGGHHGAHVWQAELVEQLEGVRRGRRGAHQRQGHGVPGDEHRQWDGPTRQDCLSYPGQVAVQVRADDRHQVVVDQREEQDGHGGRYPGPVGCVRQR
eukprot:scaffold149627_cov39-Prasinocladus_malaysianus.AAC.1